MHFHAARTDDEVAMDVDLPTGVQPAESGRLLERRERGHGPAELDGRDRRAMATCDISIESDVVGF